MTLQAIPSYLPSRQLLKRRQSSQWIDRGAGGRERKRPWLCSASAVSSPTLLHTDGCCCNGSVIIILLSYVAMWVRLCEQAAFPGQGALPEPYSMPPPFTLCSFLLSCLLSCASETHPPRAAASNGVGNDMLHNLQKHQCTWPSQTNQAVFLLTITPRFQPHFSIKGRRSTFQS